MSPARSSGPFPAMPVAAMVDNGGGGRAAIEVEDVTFGYGREVILDHVDLVVRDRDFLAILGPNGGGKSTLLKVVLGLLRPWAGRVDLHLRRRRGAIGYVPQFADFDRDFPLDVQSMVMMGRLGLRGLMRPYGRIDRIAVTRVLERFGLRDEAHEQIGDLSGGQLQRALIARARGLGPGGAAARRAVGVGRRRVAERAPRNARRAQRAHPDRARDARSDPARRAGQADRVHQPQALLPRGRRAQCRGARGGLRLSGRGPSLMACRIVCSHTTTTITTTTVAHPEAGDDRAARLRVLSQCRARRSPRLDSVRRDRHPGRRQAAGVHQWRRRARRLRVASVCAITSVSIHGSVRQPPPSSPG